MNPFNKALNKILQDGTVIPAHPLALNRFRKLDEIRQRALTHYYIDSGAGGIAVGVHTTQFNIRQEKYNIYKPVLKLAMDTAIECEKKTELIKIAGIVGPIDQARKEAEIAADLGYDLGLLSMGGLPDLTEQELIQRAEKIMEIIPLFGFYLQPAVGGKILNYEFWKDFAELPSVYAIKIAPFNRYQTLDVVRAICGSSRFREIALYTGNDDNIITDLLTTYRFLIHGEIREKQIVGGLLGQWAVWTKKAVELLNEIKEIKKFGHSCPLELLTKGASLTDANAAIFDSRNNFKGCIPGIHEIMRRQGIMEGTWCLDPAELLSPGQSDEITRIYSSYPALNDDEFVNKNLRRWLNRGPKS